jgi:dihydrofolate synthase/folylpolyglutamate synthase
MERVGDLTGVRGRLTVLAGPARALVDVAHNPDAMRALARTLRRLRIHPRVAVVGVSADKDLRAIARALRTMTTRVIAVAARTHRSRPAAEIAAACRREGLQVAVAPTVADGIRLARAIRGGRGPMLVTGSHFVAGEAVAFLERKPYLTISQ